MNRAPRVASFAVATAAASSLCVALGLLGCEKECYPPCRDGFVCVKAECVSACNPPCPADKVCRLGECIFDESMPPPSVVVNVPLDDSPASAPATAAPEAPPPPVSLGVPELACMGEDADGFYKCNSKPGLAMVERFKEKHFALFGECLTELTARRPTPPPAGVMKVRGEFDFVAGGGAENVAVPEDTMADDVFKKCVLKAFRKLYASDCCDYYLRLTLPLYFNVHPPPDPAAATATPATGAPGPPGR